MQPLISVLMPVLNCEAVGGLPPTMRLIAAERAAWPPATAESTQIPPALVYWSAKTLTAAASPPDVHQCITSALGLSCATAGPASASAASAPTSMERTGARCGIALNFSMDILPKGSHAVFM